MAADCTPSTARRARGQPIESRPVSVSAGRQSRPGRSPNAWLGRSGTGLAGGRCCGEPAEVMAVALRAAACAGPWAKSRLTKPMAGGSLVGSGSACALTQPLPCPTTSWPGSSPWPGLPLQHHGPPGSSEVGQRASDLIEGTSDRSSGRLVLPRPVTVPIMSLGSDPRVDWFWVTPGSWGFLQPTGKIN